MLLVISYEECKPASRLSEDLLLKMRYNSCWCDVSVYEWRHMV